MARHDDMMMACMWTMIITQRFFFEIISFSMFTVVEKQQQQVEADGMETTKHNPS